ncbi:MAG: hypothetical protein E5299_00608 [Burkholderia gladioli]|nr:MAG: hypothetical protein E5299_00608 [Burkholderia gladioli]
MAILVERMSHSCWPILPNVSAASALVAFTTKLQALIIEPLRQTLTYDQSREMPELTALTNVALLHKSSASTQWHRPA